MSALRQHITSRTALEAAQAAAADAVAASPFPGLYAELQARIRAWEGSPFAEGSNEQNALWDAVAHAQDAIADTPPASALDFAYKIVAADEQGAIDKLGPHGDALVAGAKAMIGAAAARPATAAPESEIMRLFREWKHLHATYPAEAAAIDEDDALVAAHTERIWAIEAQMLTTPSASMSDTIMKLAAHSNFGDLAVTNVEASQIWAEVRRFVG